MHFPLFFEALCKTHEFFPECVSIFLFLFSPPSSVSTADNTLNGHKQLIRTKWEEIRRILASRGNWESEIIKKLESPQKNGGIVKYAQTPPRYLTFTCPVLHQRVFTSHWTHSTENLPSLTDIQNMLRKYQLLLYNNTFIYT